MNREDFDSEEEYYVHYLRNGARRRRNWLAVIAALASCVLAGMVVFWR